jgi:hypothetical protein
MAAVVAAPETAAKETAMSEKQTVEVAAQVETPEAVGVKETEQAQDEAQPVEETPAEATDQAVEAETPEGEQVTENAQEAAPEAEPLSRDEFVKIVDEFGAEIAAQTVRDGGDYSTALRLAYDASKAERMALRGRVAELEAKAGSSGRPVPVTEHKEIKPLFSISKK